VNRAFVYYPSKDTPKQLDFRKEQLSNVIVEVLRRHPKLSYFQGYHDIVQVLLLVLGPDDSIPAVRRLSLLRIRDFMLPSMSGSMPHLHLLPSILYAADRTLFSLLPQQPFFALAATLTLYSHDIQEYSDIARLFDFLLAREAVMSVYLFAVIVLSRKEELMEIEPHDVDMMHFTLSKLPQPLDLEGLIGKTVTLFAQHPPSRLPFRAWSHISPNSVLKTTADLAALSRQTLEDGEHWLDEQSMELERQKSREEMIKAIKLRLRMYRRPAMLGAAVAVGIVAVYLGRMKGAERLWIPGLRTLYSFFQ
jgi:hypothetical protein